MVSRLDKKSTWGCEFVADRIVFTTCWTAFAPETASETASETAPEEELSPSEFIIFVAAVSVELLGP